MRVVRTSRATDEVNGTTMTARISAADNMPRPNGGPLKNGSAFSDGGNDCSNDRTSGTRTKMPVYIERSIFELAEIYINGGKRGFLVGIAPAELRRVLDFEEVEVRIEG